MTDADSDRLSELEFRGGLYIDEDFGPCIPSYVMEGAIVKAAKSRREGPKAKAGFIVHDNTKLEYDGPRTPEELWKNGEFVHKALVLVNGGRVLRTRPIFRDWAAEVESTYNDELVDQQTAIDWFKIAGAQIGIGDWRPKYGLFAVEILSLVEAE